MKKIMNKVKTSLIPPEDNHMNWRSVKLLAVGVCAYLALRVGIDFLVRYTTKTQKTVDPSTGEAYTLTVAGSSPFESLLYFARMGDVTFSVLFAYVLWFFTNKLFFKNTIGSKKVVDKVDAAIDEMSPEALLTMIVKHAAIIVAAIVIAINIVS